jgi:hypothetical protein
VIAETDQALAAVLKTRVIGTAPIDIAFNSPGRPWMQSLQAPTVNVFLFDLHENTQRRESSYENVRNEEGIVIARRPPTPRWDLFYTITVFIANPIIEHKVLGAITRYFSSIEVLPEDVLPPELAETGYPVLVRAGLGIKRSFLLNYAGEVKAGLDITVTVPMPPPPAPQPAPPVQEQPTIRVEPVPGADPARTVAASETAPSGPPRPAAEPADEAPADPSQAAAPPAEPYPPLPKPMEPLTPEAVADATAPHQTAPAADTAPTSPDEVATAPAEPEPKPAAEPESVGATEQPTTEQPSSPKPKSKPTKPASPPKEP